jgi:Ca2+/Na+ antiporter
MIMLSVCLFALLSFGFVVLAPALPFFILLALLIILALAYIFHYYRLENGVQKWYELYGRIRAASAAMEESECKTSSLPRP